VVTVEPGIYLEKSFGVRIEDMVLIKRNKAENLTKTPKQIDSLILSIS
ncbi:M24 family metallopeptidase, partial [Patescibacteria group bacterium]|nr:M24 family metallopeptidase [Patescibacteria group bacterium]MBU1953887.1 M24 family metallopeptidase [Patescibacteria group bacterium]